MGDTYDTGEEGDADRAQQKASLAALGAWLLRLGLRQPAGTVDDLEQE